MCGFNLRHTETRENRHYTQALKTWWLVELAAAWLTLGPEWRPAGACVYLSARSSLPAADKDGRRVQAVQIRAVHEGRARHTSPGLKRECLLGPCASLSLIHRCEYSVNMLLGQVWCCEDDGDDGGSGAVMCWWCYWCLYRGCLFVLMQKRELLL